MSYGVFRRRPVARRLPYSRRALAVLTSAGAAPATTSLPLARRRPPAHLFRPRFVAIHRHRGIAGLPNADAVGSLPMVRRRPPYILYLHPDPPIVRLRRMVIGLPNADAIIITALPALIHLLASYNPAVPLAASHNPTVPLRAGYDPDIPLEAHER